MSLLDRHILVVEDEYMLAADMCRDLEAAGAVVVGPEPSVERALARVAGEARIDAAVLDVNLGDEMVYPVADALTARGVPFLFASGYGKDAAAGRYPRAINCSKPLASSVLLRCLDKILPEV